MVGAGDRFGLTIPGPLYQPISYRFSKTRSCGFGNKHKLITNAQESAPRQKEQNSTDASASILHDRPQILDLDLPHNESNCVIRPFYAWHWFEGTQFCTGTCPAYSFQGPRAIVLPPEEQFQRLFCPSGEPGLLSCAPSFRDPS